MSIRFSPTGLGTLNSCGWKYYYSKVEKVRPPSQVNFMKGISFHKVVEKNFKQKITTRQDLNSRDLRDLAADQKIWDVPAEGIYCPDGNVKTLLGKAKDEVIAMMPELAVHSAPVMPLLVEWSPEKKVWLDDTKEIELFFRLDVQDETGWLPDYKSGMMTQAMADANWGLTFASFVAEFGNTDRMVKPNRWTMEQFKSKSGKTSITTGFQRFETSRGREDYKSLRRALIGAKKIVDEGAWMPPPPMLSWMCKGCWYRQLPCKGKLY